MASSIQHEVLAGLRVLCVDDDSDWLEVLAIVLDMHGAVVTTRPSAELAIECLTGSVFDVVISDLAMPPGLDGYDLAHALRKMELEDASRTVTPTLAVSGDALRPSQKKRFADFQAYLSKPLDAEQLVNMVGRLAQANGQAVSFGTLAKYDEAKRQQQH